MKKSLKERLKLYIPLFRPETDKSWTTIYYGARGSGKTLHQSFETVKILRYLVRLYERKPSLPHAIVFTNSKLCKEIEEKYKGYIHYWESPDDFKYCPREHCWKGETRHFLHGAYIVFDDIANILPADNWNNTPMWLRKMFFQGRHFGIKILANLQDPNSVDVNFRRCTDRAVKFQKVWGNRDPDETKPPLKFIFGIYRRRKISAEMLWRYGDLPEATIRELIARKEENDEQLREAGKSYQVVYDDSWYGSLNVYNSIGKFLKIFNCASTKYYDTLQNVQEYNPAGFLCSEFRCIEPSHVHPWDFPDRDPDELKKEYGDKFCKYTRKKYELV